MTLQVQVTGLADLRRRLHELGETEALADDVARLGLDASDETFARRAGPIGPWPGLSPDVARQPRRGDLDVSGALRASLQATIEGDERIEIGTALFYGRFHLGGTSNGVPPRPFLAPPDEEDLGAAFARHVERTLG